MIQQYCTQRDTAVCYTEQQPPRPLPSGSEQSRYWNTDSSVQKYRVDFAETTAAYRVHAEHLFSHSPSEGLLAVNKMRPERATTGVKSTNQSINQRIDRGITQPINRSISPSPDELTKSIDEPISQSIDQKSINRSRDPSNQSVNQLKS